MEKITEWIGASGIVLFFLNLIFGKKKESAQVEQIEADAENKEEDTIGKQLSNFKSAIDIYKGLAEDLRRELGKVSAQCEILVGKVREFELEINRLLLDIKNKEARIAALESENAELNGKVSLQAKEISALQK